MLIFGGVGVSDKKEFLNHVCEYVFKVDFLDNCFSFRCPVCDKKYSLSYKTKYKDYECGRCSYMTDFEELKNKDGLNLLEVLKNQSR
jgi:hypothetical protein